MGDAAADRGPLRRLAPALALVALVGVVHATSVRNPFQYDDRSFIVENAYVRSWPEPLRYLRPPVVDSAGRLRAFWRPVTMLSFWVSFRLGSGAAGFRLVDLALHAGAVLLLYALARRLLGRLAADGRYPPTAVGPAALLAGAVLAAHPLCTQTIDEISKRDTLLAAVFALGALHAFLTALARVDGPGRGGGGWALPALLGAALEALALGSKEVACSTPVLLLLCDWLVLRPARPAAARRVAIHGVALGLAAGLGLAFVVWSARGHYPTPLAYEPVPTAVQYLLGQPLVALRYLALLLSPTGLSAYHEVRLVPTAASAAFLLPALALAALAVTVVLLRRRTPELALFVLGALVHLAPTSLARNPIAMDEDRAYLLVALYGLAAAGLLGRAADRLVRRHGPRAARWAAVVGVVAVGSLGMLSALRHRDWASPVRLWAAAAEVYPTSRSALLFLAGALDDAGRPAERLRVLEAAVYAHPSDVRARLFYAHALAAAGRGREAVALAGALEREAPDSPEVQTLLGHLHRAAGDFDAAAAAYRRALRLDPGAVTACIYLADCERRLGDRDEARRLLGCVPRFARLSPGERSIVEALRASPP